MADISSQLTDALRDRYLLERELGRGGMATVFLAQDLRHDRPVALKVLHPELAATLGPERFLGEIRLTARLQHPHILPVHDSGRAAGLLWYTMPYVEGESLRQRLNREKQVPLEDALQIARNVLAALLYAHSRGVVHRDIKPENILLEAGEAVVADFGIARAIGAAGGERLTQTGLALGTPSYMSPEQATGERQLDGRTDLYSLGCVLYEMLAGEPPFTGPTAQAIIAKRLSEPVPHLGTVRQVPPAVEAAVTKALAKVPADRFQTAAEVAAALDTPFAEARAPAHEAPVPARQPLSRRSWLRLSLAGGLAAALAAALWWGASRSVGRPRPGNPASPKSVAVLPFTNLSADPDNEYFSDGITEDLVTQLAKIRDLEVVSRTSAMRYKHTDKPLREIGRELGAANLMEGSVRRAGTRVRVSAQLIDAATDRHLWAETYDREMTDVFAIQADIAQRIAAALQARILPAGEGAPGEEADGESRGVQLVPAGPLSLEQVHRAGPEAESRLFQAGDREGLELCPGVHRLGSVLLHVGGRLWPPPAEGCLWAGEGRHPESSGARRRAGGSAHGAGPFALLVRLGLGRCRA